MITEQQRLNRLNGIGASDSPIIMGFSNFKTPYELYLEKIGQISADNTETPQQYWGNMLEDAVRKHFEKVNDVIVTEPDTVYHSKYPFIFANLDGFIESKNAVLEIKCANSFMKQEWDDALEDGIPMQYLIQIAKQVAIMNADVGYCAVLIGGNEYRQYTYERDLELERLIIDSDIEFWNRVQERREPDPIRISDLVLRYPGRTGENINSSNEIYEVISNIKHIQTEVKEKQVKIDEYKMEVMNYMKDAENLVDESDFTLATWKKNKRGIRTLLIK